LARGAGPVWAWLGPVRNVRDEMRWKKEQEKKPNEKNKPQMEVEVLL